MRRYTTPIQRFIMPYDMTNATIYVTYQQDGETILEKGGSDITIEGNVAYFYLTQEETALFKKRDAAVQLRWVFEDGTADASQIFHVTVNEVLKNEVITHGI